LWSKLKIIKIMFGNSSNPILQEKTFNKERVYGNSATMTVNGTIEKTGVLLLILIVAASYTWQMAFNSGDIENASASMFPWMIGGAIGGLVVAIAMMFMHKYAAYLAPIYAVLEGLFIGAISAFFEFMYPGVVMNAVLGTFGTFLVMLFAYRTGLIKVTEKLRAVIIGATIAVGITYLLTWVLGMFGVNMGFMHGNGLLSIGISLAVIVIAAFNLLLDFDMIERGAQSGAPKYMEWIGAFGLLVTLVWLYIEFLKLLSKLQSRD